jgi:hypothetical protein
MIGGDAGKKFICNYFNASLAFIICLEFLTLFFL